MNEVRPEFDPRRNASPEKGEEYIRRSVAWVVCCVLEEMAALPGGSSRKP